MNETANSEGTSTEPEKPVLNNDVVIFPPFPDPTNEDFDEDICEEERNYYKSKFPDLNAIKTHKLHCSACDRHLGCSARNESRMRAHPMLRTLVCHTCHTFYNSGEFDKGDDGSELYCRWCGQGGQVYCCSDCPHVFCAKCIRRNLGTLKIRDIENADDWKCFKCNPKCLWDLRAICWALLRYCDLKNKITYKTQDAELKETYQKDCAIDHSECCKNKSKRKTDSKKKEDKKEIDPKNDTAAVISKISSTIQVKKFAAMPVEDIKIEKKAQKRPASPKSKVVYMKNATTITPAPKLLANPVAMPPLTKKIRMPTPVPILRFNNPERKVNTTPNFTRIRPRIPQIPQMPITILNSQYNGFHNINPFNNMVISDNINLSLESLTQGLDMAAVAAIANNGSQDDDVVCTPDFPLEPLCEVTEDNTDDDVQCITPGPVVPPKVSTPPPLVQRTSNALPEISNDNIIQMTENDVTVNASTGGLKFRVDPQTLSSNKMYRLPDGRIFAINANPNMPGGYSATIVAVAESVAGKEAAAGKIPSKGPIYAAKLSAVTTQTPLKTNRRSNTRPSSTKRSTPKSSRVTRSSDQTSRECDLNVPIEWYRYNLIDAVDALEYSLSRLHKLKKDATSMYLRSRSVSEMKNLHKTLDRLLNTSSTRFNEIRDNLNKEIKQYLIKKIGENVSDDDDDVEILNDAFENEDPIFIDENSADLNINDNNCPETQEVDLTIASSEHNDSGENNLDRLSKTDGDPISNISISDEKTNCENEANDTISETCNVMSDDNNESGKNKDEIMDANKESSETHKDNNSINNDHIQIMKTKENAIFDKLNHKEKITSDTTNKEIKLEKTDDRMTETSEANSKEPEADSTMSPTSKELISDDEKKLLNEKNDDIKDSDEKVPDTEMSEEMIETLLQDDSGKDGNNT